MSSLPTRGPGHQFRKTRAMGRAAKRRRRKTKARRNSKMEREQLIRQPGDDDYSWMHGHELQPFILLMLLLVCIKYVVALIMIQMGQVKLTGFHVLFLIGDASNVHLEFLFLLLSFSTFYGLCCLDQLDFLDDAVFSGRHSRSNVHLEHLLFLFVICCLYVAALMVKRGQMNPGRFPVYLAIADASNVHLEYPVTLLLYCVKYVVCLMIRREQLEPGVYVYSRVPGGDKIHLEFLLMVFLCCMKYVIPFIIKSQWEQPKQPGDHVYSRMLGVISAHYPLLLIALLIRCVKHGFSKTIQKEQLKPGDHIYSWRRGGLISHHGIYVGDGKVIHYTRGAGQRLGLGFGSDDIIIASSQNPWDNSCPKCGDQSRATDVLLSCIDCFLSGEQLYVFEYGVRAAYFLLKARGGTCSLLSASPPEQVLHRATLLLENGFGDYHLFGNNCEDFAIYCKTSFLRHNSSHIGVSGQASSLRSASKALQLTFPFPILGFPCAFMSYYVDRWRSEVKFLGTEVVVKKLLKELKLKAT